MENVDLTTLLDLAKWRERERDSKSHARHSPNSKTFTINNNISSTQKHTQINCIIWKYMQAHSISQIIFVPLNYEQFMTHSQEYQLMTLLQLTTAKKMEDAHLTRMHCDWKFSNSKMTTYDVSWRANITEEVISCLIAFILLGFYGFFSIILLMPAMHSGKMHMPLSPPAQSSYSTWLFKGFFSFLSKEISLRGYMSLWRDNFC